MGEQRLAAFRELVSDHWEGFLKGVEKEGLRVDGNGFIAQTPHPQALGSPLTHSRITTDYSEALLELITPVCDSTESVLRALEQVHTYVQQNLGDEVLWPLSMPCRLDGDESIPIAQYGSSNVGQLKTVYRHGLAERYGRVMQSIAGTHYNFSLPDGFWSRWQQALGDQQPLPDFKTEQYFWLIRNFRRRSWMLMMLFGSSPALDRSFVAGRRHQLQPWDAETWHGPSATSLRMSDLGYNNQAQSSLDICFNRLATYTETLDNAIHTPWPPYEKIGLFRDGQRIQITSNVLQIENEYYSAIRPKRTTHTGEKPLHALQRRGVEYVEVRCLDLDPFSGLGMDAEQIDFLDLFLLDCLLDDSSFIDDDECDCLDNAFQDVVKAGRSEALKLPCGSGGERAREVGLRHLDRMEQLASLLPGADAYRSAVKTQRSRLAGEHLLPSARLMAQMSDSGQSLVEWGMAQAKNQQQALRQQGLSPEQQETLADEARESLAEQQRIEASETESFETFLSRYLSE